MLKIMKLNFHIANCRRSLRPRVIALFPGQQRSLNRLKEMREKLANELTELINELGPKIWDDFDNVNLQTLFSCSWIAADLIMTNSIVSSSLQPACRLHPASLAYGGGRAGRVASMLKEISLFTQW